MGQELLALWVVNIPLVQGWGLNLNDKKLRKILGKKIPLR
ncbi:hypothetical protein GCM10008018_73020 [Paenibacillus marchantiophytorum]|uniref:Uncharacterized protein n=2 Tax=Bacteria TaxID=2 RepID=A0ABQ1UD63_9GAMM|nr:hypothetical protein GCM10008018_73020 [Paenibacillus marchantiophytorum]GGF16004.1 hypothetical protein GCM10008027_45870 [Pseudoalteromonas profundi]